MQRCLSLTAHAYSGAFFLASPDLLEDLSGVQTDALMACARVGAQASRVAASRGEQEGVAHLRAQGMLIVEDVDRAALAAKSYAAIEAAVARFGPDRVARIRAS